MENEWKVVQNGRRARKQAFSVSHAGRIKYGQQQKTKKEKQKEAMRPCLREQIEEIGKALRETEWYTKTMDLLREGVARRKVVKVKCAGLGSFVESGNARHQLALAILLTEMSGCAGEMCDPVMSGEDVELVRGFGLEVVGQTSVDRVGVGECCILFLPHCGRDLNERIVRECGALGGDGFVLLANRLCLYIGRKWDGESAIEQMWKRGDLKEQVCPNAESSTRETAFNDLSVTTIGRD